MSRCLRPRIAGATAFFTVTLADGASDLLVREVAVLREAVRATPAERCFGIDARVVLPDHMHCVWTLPEGDADHSVRMGAIKARFTMGLRRSGFSPTSPANSYGAKAGRVRVGVNPDLQKDEAPVWQKRFWEHHIRDDRDFGMHVRYCWTNPVKHGLVGHPREWPFASWHRDAGGAVW